MLTIEQGYNTYNTITLFDLNIKAFHFITTQLPIQWHFIRLVPIIHIFFLILLSGSLSLSLFLAKKIISMYDTYIENSKDWLIPDLVCHHAI